METTLEGDCTIAAGGLAGLANVITAKFNQKELGLLAQNVIAGFAKVITEKKRRPPNRIKWAVGGKCCFMILFLLK
jgi:hypothetical protein